MIKFKVGDKVRVRSDILDPMFGWGGAQLGDEGVVVEVGRNDVYVDFPHHIYWHTINEEIELTQPLKLENI